VCAFARYIVTLLLVIGGNSHIGIKNGAEMSLGTARMSATHECVRHNWPE
jgi:hypothetical protein